METIEIDGSYGEGGGQILRTSLGLACLLARPVRLYNIRKGRKRPGLMPQHLMSCRALAAVSGAKITGDAHGSAELLFEPGRPGGQETPEAPRRFSFDIGTAGSTSLLFQALLPPMALFEGTTVLELKGGTHVPMSPPFDYIKEVFLPFLDTLGIKVSSEIESYGFYPRGGGLVRFFIEPSRFRPSAGGLIERGGLLELKGVSAVAGLPMDIARRQRDALAGALGARYKAEVALREVPAMPGVRGTYVFLLARYEHAVGGFSAIGTRGKRAEAVGEEAAQGFVEHDASEGFMEPHLADQASIYLAAAKTKTPASFTTSRITRHLLTNLWVLERFLPGFGYSIEGQTGSPGKVSFLFE